MIHVTRKSKKESDKLSGGNDLMLLTDVFLNFIIIAVKTNTIKKRVLIVSKVSPL